MTLIDSRFLLTIQYLIAQLEIQIQGSLPNLHSVSSGVSPSATLRAFIATTTSDSPCNHLLSPTNELNLLHYDLDSASPKLSGIFFCEEHGIFVIMIIQDKLPENEQIHPPRDALAGADVLKSSRAEPGKKGINFIYDCIIRRAL